MKQRLVFQRITSAWSFHVDSGGVCCVCCYSGFMVQLRGERYGFLGCENSLLCCSMISADMNIE